MDMENKDLAGKFIDYCRYQRGLSENTIRAYNINIKEYLDYLTEKGIDPTAVKIGQIDDFVIHLRRDIKNVATTINAKVYALKSFYKYLLRGEMIVRNPMEFVKSVKEPRRLPFYLNEGQQEAVLRASKTYRKLRVPGDEWFRQRDYLLVLTLLDTGIRISELVGIETKNIDLKEGVLKVRGKGDREREIVMSTRLIRAIEEYVQLTKTVITSNGAVGPGLPARGWNARRLAKETCVSYNTAHLAIAGTPNDNDSALLRQVRAFVDQRIKCEPFKFLFFNQGGKKLGSRHAFRLIQSIGNKVGIKGLHPHCFRHSMSSNLLRKGADLTLIQKTLGHQNIQTTAMYSHLTSDEYKTRMRALIN